MFPASDLNEGKWILNMRYCSLLYRYLFLVSQHVLLSCLFKYSTFLFVRQLVIQYVRHRAERGAKFQRADWASLSDLPAPPSACGKRMSSLKKNKVFRKALMRLLNIVSKRYVKHLQKMHSHTGDGCIPFLRNSLNRDGDRIIPIEAQLTDEEWDGFSCQSIKQVLEEVLRCKRITNLDAYEEVQFDSEKYSNVGVGSGGYVYPLLFFILSITFKHFFISQQSCFSATLPTTLWNLIC